MAGAHVRVLCCSVGLLWPSRILSLLLTFCASVYVMMWRADIIEHGSKSLLAHALGVLLKERANAGASPYPYSAPPMAAMYGFPSYGFPPANAAVRPALSSSYPLIENTQNFNLVSAGLCARQSLCTTLFEGQTISSFSLLAPFANV